MAPNTSKIPIGTVLVDKYRVTREIGRGGMAAVYEAENIHIGKRVAVKVLAQELISSTIVVERFLREARAAASISSPYICDVYDSGKLEDGRPFLVLELLEGESLYERMTRVRQIDMTTTVQMVTQVARGLTKAHAANVVHRDLKPENIFLTKDEEGKLVAKILDFGLAKFYAPVSEEAAPQARLTREGAVFGTPAYMSPEQVKGQGQVDHRADLWALGCMTYECLTGRTVWSTEQGVAMTFAQIASSPLPNALGYRPDLPPSFQTWFAKALARSADDRFQSAKELADELAKALSDSIPGVISLMSLAEIASKHVRSVDPARAGEAPPVLHAGGAAEAAAADARPFSPPGEMAPGTPSPYPPSAGVGGRGSPYPGTGGNGYGSAPSSRPPPSSPRSVRGAGSGRRPRSSGGGSSLVQDDEVTIARDPPRKKRRAGFTLLGVGTITAAGYFGWLFFVRPAAPPITRGAMPSATTAASGTPAASVDPAAFTAAKGPKWAPLVLNAQAQIAANSFPDAIKSLKEASDIAGGGPPRLLLEQTQIAAVSKGLCRTTALARPRPYALMTPAGRPTLAFTPKGALVGWTDDHESAGHDHAYVVQLDSAMRTTGDPRDVTPEAGLVQSAQLFAVGDKVGVLYADAAKGPEAGLHIRWLDAEGRIAAPARSVTARKTATSAAIGRAPDGSFWAAWEDERPGDMSDLFMRHLSADLEPIGSDVRSTDYIPTHGVKPRVRTPSVGVSGGFLNVVFRFDREPQRAVSALRIALSDPTLPKGLDAGAEKGPPKDRLLGDVMPINADKEKVESPRMECVAEGCYVVWQGETGIYAAYLESAHGQVLWRKRFDRKGSHPNVAVAPSGAAELVWYSKGRLSLAPIGRDGVGTPTSLARVGGDPPPATLAPGGAPGEWYAAWLEAEAGHPEIYAMRALCK